MKWIALGVILAFSTGCPTVDCPDLLDIEATLVVGTGTNSFEPLDEATVLEGDWGDQGGTHVWLSVLTEGIHGGYRQAANPISGMANGRDEPDVTVAVTQPNGREVAAFSSHVGLTSGEARGITAVLMSDFSGDFFNSDDAETVALLEETEAMDLDLAVGVEDTCGTTLEMETTVRIRFPWLQR
jgi:hypothetical protein